MKVRCPVCNKHTILVKDKRHADIYHCHECGGVWRESELIITIDADEKEIKRDE